MSPSFYFGNVWLLAAFVVYWGGQTSGSGNLATWQLFGIGRRFAPYQYSLFLYIAVGISLLCFLRHFYEYMRELRTRQDAAARQDLASRLEAR
jgi:hypothetical protein